MRATVLSITGQADAVGQAAGGPVLGAIGNVWGIRAALTVGALVAHARRSALYARALRHGGAGARELRGAADAAGRDRNRRGRFPRPDSCISEEG